MPRLTLAQVALFFVLLVTGGKLALAAEPFLIGESQSQIRHQEIGPAASKFALGLQMGSNLPLSRPFRADTGSGFEDFQFQVSRAIGLEIEMGWTKTLSFAIQSGWEHFESRLDTSAGINTEYQNAQISLIPIILSAKYRFRDAVWTPTLETGVGMGLYRYSYGSTNSSATTDRESTASFLAQALVGLRFFWNDSTSIDFNFGYRYTAVGNRSLNNGLQAAEARGFTGLYSRGGLSYIF